MKCNMKLKAAILAAIMAASALFTACGQEEGKVPASSSAGKQESSKQEESKKDEKVEYPVVSWYMMNSESLSRDQDIVQEAANEILREKIGCEVQFYFIDSGSYNDKMNAMINAGETFDLMLGGGGTARKFDAVYNKGGLADITDLLKEYGQGILEKVDERAWESVTREGRIYAIPNQMPWVTENVITIRKDLAEKYELKLDEITSYKDMEPFFETLKANEPDVIPLCAPAGIFNVATQSVAVGNYSPVIDNLLVFDYADNKMKSILEMEEFVEVAKAHYDWYQKGYISKDALALMGNSAEEPKTGKYAVLNCTAEYSGGEKSTAIMGFDCVEVLLNRSEITTANMQLVLTYISSTSKQPENAMKVLNEVWSNPELSNLLAYGIEDVHYTVTANAGTDHPSVLPKSGDEQRWAIYHNYLGPLWDQWDSTWNSAEALVAMQERNASAPTSQLIGFRLEQESIKTQIAELTAIVSEVMPVLKSGTMPDYDAYIAELEKRFETAGLDEVIAEAQRQYEEWVKIR